MNAPKAFCPKCKNEVLFNELDGTRRRCPVCGFRFDLTPPRFDSSAPPSEVGEILTAVGRFFLILAVLVVVAVAVVFAGCALIMR